MSTHVTHPFRFGLQVATAPSRVAWVDLARRAEANGYSVLTMPDHFTEQLAPVPALMCAANATTTLRVGARVWDNDYKHPVVLGKELATMDVLTDGRLEIGLGAGWMISDYEQAGMSYDRAGLRIDRFEEGLKVIRGAMAPGPFSFVGKHYTITDYDGTPKPVQWPCPPILIGGGGKRMLGIAAREADIVGVNGNLHAGVIGPNASMTAEAVDEKLGIIREAAGSRFTDIELNVRVLVVNVTDDRDGTMDFMTKAMQVEHKKMVESTPFALIGPPAKLVEDLLERRERWGFSYIIVGGGDVESFAPVVAQLDGK